MVICRFCFQEVRDGIPVPGYGRASGAVHEQCFAEAVLKFATVPVKEGLLRYVVDYEEKYAPRDWSKRVSGGSADISWNREQVGLPVSTIRHLLDAGLISIVVPANPDTNYALVGRGPIKQALEKLWGKERAPRRWQPTILKSPKATLSASLATKVSQHRRRKINTHLFVDMSMLKLSKNARHKILRYGRWPQSIRQIAAEDKIIDLKPNKGPQILDPPLTRLTKPSKNLQRKATTQLFVDVPRRKTKPGKNARKKRIRKMLVAESKDTRHPVYSKRRYPFVQGSFETGKRR